MVRETGLEPVSLAAEDFKSAVYTIPPLSHVFRYVCIICSLQIRVNVLWCY